MGAIGGALLLQQPRKRLSTDAVVSASVALLGVATAVTGMFRTPATLGPLMLVAGASWITFISLFSAMVQTMAPDWVRARTLAIFLLVFQGGLAAGSAVWGVVGERAGIDAALACAGACCVAIAGLGLLWRLPIPPADVSPWNHWRMPAVAGGVELKLDDGPVLVTVEYFVDAGNASAFMRAMRKYEHVRRRDGAARWGLYRDTEMSDRYVETFVVGSWAEHLRQHARLTQADRALEERVYALARGKPRTRHLIDARSG